MLTDKRDLAFQYLSRWLGARTCPVIVEIGSIRSASLNHAAGDGWSTVFWHLHSVSHPCLIWSVDTNPKAREVFETLCPEHNVNFVTEDGVRFCELFQRSVDLLFLDGWDCDVPGSADEHLKCLQNIESRLTGLVAIDDVTPGGKGAKAIPYLESKGWRKVVNTYVVVLSK